MSSLIFLDDFILLINIYFPSFLFLLFLFLLYSFFIFYIFFHYLMSCLFPVTSLTELCSFFITGAEGWRVSARLIAPSQSLQLMALPGWRSVSCDSQIALSSWEAIASLLLRPARFGPDSAGLKPVPRRIEDLYWCLSSVASCGWGDRVEEGRRPEETRWAPPTNLNGTVVDLPEDLRMRLCALAWDGL